MGYELSPPEAALYEHVTTYVREGMARAERLKAKCGAARDTVPRSATVMRTTSEGWIAMTRRIDIEPGLLARFCERHAIVRLSLFGSQLTGAARPDSDVDLLVEFESGRGPGLIALAQMEAELSAMLGGRTVDMRTPRDLSRYFRADVTRTAELRYAR